MTEFILTARVGSSFDLKAFEWASGTMEVIKFEPATDSIIPVLTEEDRFKFRTLAFMRDFHALAKKLKEDIPPAVLVEIGQWVEEQQSAQRAVAL